MKAISVLFAFLLFLFCSSFAKPTFAVDLVINEFSSDTLGTESDPDWIEIYNNGTENIDLSLYRIRDNSATNKLDLSETIDPKSFKAFDWSNKLNKPGDSIRLLLISNEENIIDEISYGDKGSVSVPSSGQSSGRKTDGVSEWVIFSSSSKESTNNTSAIIPSPTLTLTPTPSPTKVPTPTKTPTPTKSPTNPPTPTTKTPTPTKTQALTKKLIGSISPSKEKTKNILGESTASISAGPTKEPQKVAKVLAASENRTSQILIGIGFAFLIACGIVAGVQKIKKDRLINE